MGNSNRMLSLMMKVGATAGIVKLMIDNSAVILGEELVSSTTEGDKCPNCEADITLKQIEDVFGVLPDHKAFRQEIVDNLNKFINERKGTSNPVHIDTCLRKAHFFAQVGAETLGIHPDWMVETDVIPYRPRNIGRALFGDRSVKLRASGNLETYCAERPQRKLLSFLYARENGFGNGNGNEASGDGYTFRGRGLKQLTGRGNYRTAATYLNEIFPSEYIDIEASPDRVKESKYAVLTAIAFWEKKAVWQTADQITVVNDENVKRIRRRVNGGTAAWEAAKTHLEKGMTVFKVNDCTPVEANTGTGNWHDPVVDPMCTIFTQSQTHGDFNASGKHWGLFGNTRGRVHHGLDLFGTAGTPIYACVKCEVTQVTTGANPPGGYGKQILLKVLDRETFLAHHREYTQLYPDLEYNFTSDFSKDRDIYLHYAHLRKVYVRQGWVITNVNVPIGEIGTSGVPNGGTCAPHLHFEIRNENKARYNPGFFIDFKHFDTMSAAQKTLQQTTARAGKFPEVNGQADALKTEADYA